MKLPEKLSTLLLGSIFIIPGLLLTYIHTKYFNVPLKQKTTYDEVELSTNIKITNQAVEDSVAEEEVGGTISQRKEVRVRLPVPDPYWQVINEQFNSGPFSLVILQENGQRNAIFSLRKGQDTHYEIGYRLQLKRKKGVTAISGKLEKQREFKASSAREFKGWLQKECGKSGNVFQLSRECLNSFLRYLVNDRSDWLAEVTGASDLSSFEFAEALAELFDLSGLSSVAGLGLPLGSSSYQSSYRPVVQMTASKEATAYIFDLRTHEVMLRRNYFLWGDYDDIILGAKGISNLKISVATAPKRANVQRLSAEGAEVKAWVAPLFEKYLNLSRLPIGTQVLYEIVVLLPFAALAIGVLRNVVGIVTFGTFLPALLALALLQSGLVAGLILTVVVIFVGVLARWIFDRMHLLLVPRLAAVLTTVTILFLIITQTSYELGWQPGQTVSLFPMVVLTMLIERLTLIIDELGLKVGLTRFIYTLVAALLCYLVLKGESVRYLFFAFPELILVVLGLAILLGRYTGYRLTELVRFRELAK